MSNNNDSQMSANRYVSTSASDQPQAPNVNESPVASVLQAAASAVGKAAEGLGITGMAAKMKDDTEVQKEWRESGSKEIDARQPSKSGMAAAKLVGQGGGMAMQPTPEEGGQSEPSVSGQSTGRKNEFTLTNQETRDEMKRIFDLTDTGEKGKEQAYQERRV